MNNILVLVNPNARQGNQLEPEIKNWLKDQGYNVLNSSLGSDKDKMNVIIEKYHHKKPIVLVGGGDGSVNEVLSSLTKYQLPLVVIPCGTANNLARSLDIPSDHKEALSLLLQGKIKNIDVGVANGIHFVNVIGIGLSTQVNRAVPSKMKRIFGVFAFVMTALQLAKRMTPFRVRIRCDNKEHTAYSWQLSVCNGRNYGNGLVIHEDAKLDDQTLHALSTEVEKWWHAFALVPSLLTGKFKTTHPVTAFSGNRMEIETKRPMNVDVDGDVKTKTPIKVEILPRALQIYVPH
ncbi:lipid kinase [Bdellovibrio sp. HCB288]|uniref:lipid kinase n=1 Tax=Bdellovibrio sp. HCB288 TaxID=3394355 RepID=UPI0039B50522